MEPLRRTEFEHGKVAGERRQLTRVVGLVHGEEDQRQPPVVAEAVAVAPMRLK